MNETTQNDKDPELQDAYERLGSSLRAPVDVLERVERRVRVRRRHRLAAAGGASLVALATAGTLVVLAVSGNDPTNTLVTDQPTSTGPVSTLTIARTDGSTYTFQDITVSCHTDADSGQQRILAASPRRFEGETALEPFVMFEAILDKVAGGRTFELPSESASGSSDSRPMTLFFATDEGGQRSNELSSAEGDASGTVEVVSATCGATPALELVVDATLGSEVEQAPMRISGELR